jgi:hypothetical protein
MPTPTGTISMSDVNTELGRSSTATISLGETAVRTLAGVASGAISMDNLRGKSSGPVFTPAGGESSGAPVALYDSASGNQIAVVTISCDQSAVWTHTRTGFYGTPSASTSTGQTRVFSLSNNTTSPRYAFWTVSATAGGVTKYWTVQLENDGYA